MSKRPNAVGLLVCEQVIIVTNLSFPAPARYQLTLLAEGEWVAQTVVQLLATEG